MHIEFETINKKKPVPKNCNEFENAEKHHKCNIFYLFIVKILNIQVGHILRKKHIAIRLKIEEAGYVNIHY